MKESSDFENLFTLISYAQQTFPIDVNIRQELTDDVREYDFSPNSAEEYDCNILYGISAYDMNN